MREETKGAVCGRSQGCVQGLGWLERCRPEARVCLTSRIGATDTSLGLAADRCGHLLDEAQLESQWQPPQAGCAPMTICILSKVSRCCFKGKKKGI